VFKVERTTYDRDSKLRRARAPASAERSAIGGKRTGRGARPKAGAVAFQRLQNLQVDGPELLSAPWEVHQDVMQPDGAHEDEGPPDYGFPGGDRGRCRIMPRGPRSARRLKQEFGPSQSGRVLHGSFTQNVCGRAIRLITSDHDPGGVGQHQGEQVNKEGGKAGTLLSSGGAGNEGIGLGGRAASRQWRRTANSAQLELGLGLQRGNAEENAKPAQRTDRRVRSGLRTIRSCRFTPPMSPTAPRRTSRPT